MASHPKKDPQIVAAVIGGIFTVLASILGVVLAIILSRNSNPPPLANSNGSQNVDLSAVPGEPTATPNDFLSLSGRSRETNELYDQQPLPDSKSSSLDTPERFREPDAVPEAVETPRRVSQQNQSSTDSPEMSGLDIYTLNSKQNFPVPDREINITVLFLTSMNIEYAELIVSGRNGLVLRKPVMNAGSQFDFMVGSKSHSIAVTSIDWQQQTVDILMSDKSPGDN